MVSAFAAVGDVVRPKSFAGLFGAAPSIAIATLLIALLEQGPSYIAIEGRSMILGGAALAAYSFVSCQLLKRCQFSGLISTLLSTVVWFASAFGLYWLFQGNLMAVKLKLSTLAEGHWYEYAFRFVLSGAVTMLAGWIAKEWGPVIGGLFLAFPAIFPASATLVEKHERERKEKVGIRGAKRGRDAAALEAAGAALGSIGLMVFATIVWQFAPAAPGIALSGGALAWLAVSVTLWVARRHIRRAVTGI